MVPQPSGKVNVGYFVNWGIYAREYKPMAIPANKLTHILYAFGNIKETGEVFLTDSWSDAEIHYEGDSWNDVGTNLYGNFKQLYLLKKQHRGLKVLLSIGGWTFSSAFKGPCSTHEGRAEFVRSSVQLLEDYGLDGLDIDWEYPQNDEEAQYYVELLKQLREGLDQHAASKGLSEAQGYELTIAAPCGSSNYEKLRVAEMDQYLSFWNLMAYDYAGSWDPQANHQAALHGSGTTTENAVNFYASHGVAPNKLVIGIPLYGRSFLNCDGPESSYQGVGQGSWEQGIYDYKALPLAGSVESYDAEKVASSCFNPETREWVTYDTPEAAKAKAEWIVSHGYGGGMYWELSGDKTDESSLVGLVADSMGDLDTRENHLDYSGSKFDNLKAGM